MGPSVFMSHAWGPADEQSTHTKVLCIALLLESRGVRVWVDELQITGALAGDIACGMDESDVVVLFLTSVYIDKVNRGSRHPCTRNRCYQEFNYAFSSGKFVLPVLLEKELKSDPSLSTGYVGMHLADLLYVDGSGGAVEASRRIEDRILAMVKPCRRYVKEVMRL